MHCICGIKYAHVNVLKIWNCSLSFGRPFLVLQFYSWPSFTVSYCKVFLFRRQCSSDRPMLFVGSLCFLIGWGKRIISIWLQLSARLVFTCQFSPKTEFSSVWNWPILKQTHSTNIQHISPKSEHWVPKDATDRQPSFHVVREEKLASLKLHMFLLVMQAQK